MKQHGKKIMEMVMGPTGSVLLHIIIIIALVKLVYFAAAPDEPEVEVVMMEVETVDIEELKEELEELKFEEKLNDLAPPDMSVDMEMPDVADVPDVSEPMETDFAELDVVESVKSPLVMKGLYANRNAGGRKAALGAHGGSQRTEAAVLRALEWLKNHQLSDGSWGKNAKGGGNRSQRVGYTGLGLLAFLAHGEMPGSGRYSKTIEKAIRFLVDGQDDTGGFSAVKTGHEGVYAHGIATYAISEAYGMTKIPNLRSAMNRAVERIIEGQQSGGGFDYSYKDEGRRDTGVCGWNIQAMKAAKVAGCNVSGLQASLDKALDDLRSVQSEATGKFSYSQKGAGNDNNTAIAVLCLQLTGHDESAEAKKGLAALKDSPVIWDLDESAAWIIYGWYYITQAKFHEGGGDWKKWNREFSSALVRNQSEDGSWTSPGRAEGARQTYSTTLAALSLQVYYRHLPSYKKDDKGAQGAASADDDSDDEDEESLIEVI